MQSVLESTKETTGPVENANLAHSTPASYNPAYRIVIEPNDSWQPLNFNDLWMFRELIGFLALRDIKVRYKQTALGAAWAILQPLMMMAVFTLFFGRVAKVPIGEGIPGPIFFLTGLLPWIFFSSSLNAISMSVIGSERLISKIYFPRLSIPLAASAASLLDFVISCGLLAAMLAYYQIVPPATIIFAPLIAFLVMMFSLSIGIAIAALNVNYRDFRYIVPFFIQLGMFATPTIYMQPTGDEGAFVTALLYLNPMTVLVSGFRACVLGAPVPWLGLAVSAVISTTLFVFSCKYFRKVEDRFADVI